MKILNIFDRKSSLFVFRWLIVAGIVSAGIMTYYDLTGRRIFTGNSDQKWSQTGPGFHK